MLLRDYLWGTRPKIEGVTVAAGNGNLSDWFKQQEKRDLYYVSGQYCFALFLVCEVYKQVVQLTWHSNCSHTKYKLEQAKGVFVNESISSCSLC